MSGIIQGLIASLKSAAAATTDAYFNLVTLLLNTTTTNGAQNNTFLDSSSNTLTITRNGNTTQGTFTPFSQTGWGNYFNGTTDYLTSASNTSVTFGTSAYTIEMWVYQTARNASGAYLVGGSGTQMIQLNITSTGTVNANLAGGASYATTTTTVALNTWTHLAFVRTSTASNGFQIYINGVSSATGTDATNYASTNTLNIGTTNSSTTFVLSGYLSNLRVTKSGALYTGNFTPSTIPLTTTVSTGTVSLLTAQSNRFVDNSASPVTLTTVGTPSVQAFSPFAPTDAYSTTTVGGSGYFNGSTDYLSTPNVAALQLTNATAFTIECWVYLSSVAGNPSPITNYNNASPYQGYGIRVDSATTGQWQFWDGTSWNTFGPVVKANTWTHIAITYEGSGTTRRFYVNGAQQGSASTMPSSVNYTAGNLYIAGSSGGTGTITGYVSNVRIIKGTALYTGATYTIPTAPFTAITNTSLLLSGTNAGIYDAAAKNDLQTVGNAQVSTTQAKFGTTSMYFDGTSDYLTIPNSSIVNLSGDFTIEAWVYRVTTGANTNILCVGSFATSANGFAFYVSSTNYLAMFGNNAVIAIGSTTTIPANTWTYVAAVRSGTGTNNLKLYVNGTLEVQATNNTSFVGVAGNGMSVGAYYDGSAFTATASCYIDELRLTRYARTITTPTAAFPVQ